MFESREDLIEQVVVKLAFVDRNGKRRVRIDDIAKISGLEKRVVEKNLLFGKIQTLGEELYEENAKALLDRLLNYTRPEIEETLVSNFFENIPRVTNATIQPTPVSEPAPNKQSLTPESIIKNFVIVDGSNVLYWLKDNLQEDKPNLIPLLILLSALKRKGFDFHCLFDRSRELALRDYQPEQFHEFKKIQKKYPIYFAIAPGGTSADDFIVLDAKNSKRRVLSKDRFLDRMTRVPRLPKNQLISGMVANGQIAITPLDIIESLHHDLRKAVRDLEIELNK
jgi:hypothetical protein